MTGILNSMSEALNRPRNNVQPPNSLNTGVLQPNNKLAIGTAFRRAGGNVPTSPMAPPATQPTNASTLGQGNTQTQPPNTAQAVANNLNSNSVLMKSAQAQGERAAAARGLQNSSIGAEAAQRAMLDAAMPIAQMDVGNQQQDYMARLNAKLTNDNAMKELGAQVSANTIGKSIDFAMQITSNFDAQIAGVLNNTQMSEGHKKKAIEQLKASRDSEMAFMSNFMRAVPTTRQNWASFPELGTPVVRIS